MDGIDTSLRRHPDSPVVLDLLGTLDAERFRARVHEIDRCADEVFFFAASVGAVFGLLRSDGMRVAMKLH